VPPEATASAGVAAECRTFARYLAGTKPSPYVVESYARLLPNADVSASAGTRLIERSLLSVAHLGTVPLRIADAYARFLLPRSLLRRRLILLLAILENSAESERFLNAGEPGGLFAAGARLAVTMVASGLSIAVGVLVFAPLHLLSGTVPRESLQ
jgi:hypothetical protein